VRCRGFTAYAVGVRSRSAAPGGQPGRDLGQTGEQIVAYATRRWYARSLGSPSEMTMAPKIEADQGVGLEEAPQTGRPRPRRPSVRAAFVVEGSPSGGARHAASAYPSEINASLRETKRAPAIEADQGVELAKALQTGRLRAKATARWPSS
jgi:hypothetical protein